MYPTMHPLARQAYVDLYDPVYGFLVRCGVPESAREDLAQEVFLEVHRAAPEYEPLRPLVVWVLTITANTVRSHFRKQATQRRLFKDSRMEAATPEPDSLALTEARETARWIDDAITSLPLAQRQVLVLASVEHLDHGAIGEVLEIPVGTVKTHLRRARLALARTLAKCRRRADWEAAR